MAVVINIGKGNFQEPVRKLLVLIEPDSPLMHRIAALRLAQVQRKIRNSGDEDFTYPKLWPGKENRDKRPLTGKVFQNSFSAVVDGRLITVGSDFFQGQILHSGGIIQPRKAKLLFVPLRRSVTRDGVTYRVEPIKNVADRYYYLRRGGRLVRRLKFRRGEDFVFMKRSVIPERPVLHFTDGDIGEISDLIVSDLAGS